MKKEKENAPRVNGPARSIASHREMDGWLVGSEPRRFHVSSLSSLLRCCPTSHRRRRLPSPPPLPLPLPAANMTRSDSPVSRRIVLSFLDFLNSGQSVQYPLFTNPINSPSSPLLRFQLPIVSILVSPTLTGGPMRCLLSGDPVARGQAKWSYRRKHPDSVQNAWNFSKSH
jgi:hypothetical protein